MEHLANVLKSLFAYQDGDVILRRAALLRETDEEKNNSSAEYLYRKPSESTLINLLQRVNLYSTIDQKSIIVQVFQSKWSQPDYSIHSLCFTEDATVFNGLLHFCHSTLSIKDHDPICRFPRLLRWHTLSSLLGEDIFTTSYLASRDLAAGQDRKFFGWDAVIGHDNEELNALLSRPIADVHMHLKGSSFNFDLSWISIMNNFVPMQSKFNELNVQYRESSDWDQNIYVKIRRAAAIRIYLANFVGIWKNSVTTTVLDLVLNPNPGLRNEISEKLEALHTNSNQLPDYAFFQNLIDERNKYLIKNYGDDLCLPYEYLSDNRKKGINNKYRVSEILSSERRLMYLCFRKIFSKDTPFDHSFATLFYAYLAYKSSLRQQILQLNEQVGFKNFSKFETRKDIFIDPKYNNILYKSAISHFLNKSSNRFLEARLTPKTTADGIRMKFLEISTAITYSTDDYEDLQRRFGIILHFIKSRDTQDIKGYRHRKLREEIKEQCFAIVKFREDGDNWGKNPLAGLLVGVDAANSEIMCRPEVYGQTYRFLRELSTRNSVDINQPNDLKFTFHVGEDFFDIADGLRAIEEAIIFLGLKHGDRIGHGLALGTDVAQYYEMRYFTICATKQVLLDNAAWLYHKGKRIGCSSRLLEYFECIFRKYFHEVFCGNSVKSKSSYYAFLEGNDSKTPDFIRHIKGLDSIEDYYLSWLIRGNSPKFGEELQELAENVYSNELNKQWIEASMNHHPGAKMAIYNSNARDLFDAYHREDIMKRGEEADTIRIPESMREDFINLLNNIQEQLLGKLERRRIAIECNPTSNYKIGELEKYDQHPIFRFYNCGLNTSYKRHDLLVSINTDDLGVFSTSLDREYSLMALAAERFFCKDAKNTPRQIIEWLDNIRKMSIEQSFINFEDINKYL